jgi:hypothetical protein
MKVQRTIVVDKPLEAVFGYLSDFTTTTEWDPGTVVTVIAVDTLTFRTVDAATEVTYTAEFTFKGPSRLLAPLLRPAFNRLGTEAEIGMNKALNQL